MKEKVRLRLVDISSQTDIASERRRMLDPKTGREWFTSPRCAYCGRAIAYDPMPKPEGPKCPNCGGSGVEPPEPAA